MTPTPILSLYINIKPPIISFTRTLGNSTNFSITRFANHYIVETLEPQGVDIWFNWNFFDGILTQKEYFSDYVFEDLAADVLAKNTDLQTKLKEKQVSDPKFAADARAQLEFIYRNSPNYEPTHMMYPVGRLVD